MKRRRFLPILLAIFALGATSCTGGGSEPLLPTEISVMLNNETVAKVVLEVEETVQLNAVITPSTSSQTVNWSSNNDLVVTVSNNGLLTGIAKGDAVISVVSSEVTYVTKQFFVEVKQKIEHEEKPGIGSGKSSFDPIFLGDEGKDEPLEIYFLETFASYGDSMLIKKGNVDIVIDAGWKADGQKNNVFMKEKITDSRIDMLIVSHQHADHIGGMRDLIAGIDDVSVIIDYGVTSGTIDYKTLVDELVAQGTKYYSAIDCVRELNGAVGRFYLTSEFYVEVLNTDNYITGGEPRAENPQSLAMIFNYRDFNFFTAGDLETGSETTLLTKEKLPKVTLYKVSHHGAYTANSQRLLDTLDPMAVAITAGRSGGGGEDGSQNNTSNLDGAGGHPERPAMERIYKAPRIKQNRNVYWNAVNGTMCFSTHGENGFTFKGSPTRKGYYDLTMTGGVATWNPMISDFDNKVTGEDDLRLHETKIFGFRNYEPFLL